MPEERTRQIDAEFIQREGVSVYLAITPPPASQILARVEGRGEEAHVVPYSFETQHLPNSTFILRQPWQPGETPIYEQVD